MKVLVYGIKKDEARNIVNFLYYDLLKKTANSSDEATRNLHQVLLEHPSEVATIITSALVFAVANFDRIAKERLEGEVGKDGTITEVKPKQPDLGIV